MLLAGVPARRIISRTGRDALREQIAARLAATRGLLAEPGCIVVTAGTQQALRIAAELLLDPGDAAWVEDPGYIAGRGALTAAARHARSRRVIYCGTFSERLAAPLRASYAGAPRMSGLVLGFAGAPVSLAADTAKRLEAALSSPFPLAGDVV